MLEKHIHQSTKSIDNMSIGYEPTQSSDFTEPDEKDKFEKKTTQASRLSAIGEPKWVDYLPQSLKQVYHEQSHSLDCGLSAPSSLGTMPLKELVKTMHMRRFGGNVGGIHNP